MLLLCRRFSFSFLSSSGWLKRVFYKKITKLQRRAAAGVLVHFRWRWLKQFGLVRRVDLRESGNELLVGRGGTFWRFPTTPLNAPVGPFTAPSLPPMCPFPVLQKLWTEKWSALSRSLLLNPSLSSFFYYLTSETWIKDKNSLYSERTFRKTKV